MNPYLDRPARLDTAGVLYSHLAYEHEHGQRGDGIDYRARNADSEKQRRYRARRKEEKQ